MPINGPPPPGEKPDPPPPPPPKELPAFVMAEPSTPFVISVNGSPAYRRPAYTRRPAPRPGVEGRRGIACAINLILPGLGQIATGRPLIGAFLLMAWLASLAAMLVLIGFVTAPIVWLWAMIDAAALTK